MPYPPQDADVVEQPKCLQCGRLSRPGTVLCDVHHADQQIASARRRLADYSVEAVDVLIELSRTASSEAVRKAASDSILDRSGVRGGVELDVSASGGVAPADVLKQRIALLRERGPDLAEERHPPALPAVEEGGA